MVRICIAGGSSIQKIGREDIGFERFVIILKRILHKYFVIVWTGLKWFEKSKVVASCEHRVQSSRSIKDEEHPIHLGYA
jgi:hypothetical protein